MGQSASSRVIKLDAALQARLATLCDEGWEIWAHFDIEVRQQSWHSFIAADYDVVLQALLPLRGLPLRFLEWGSATGIITIMADLLGFEAYGMELDRELVDTARGLAGKYDSAARFAVGSYLPAGYRWRPGTGDGGDDTIGTGVSGYTELQHPLEHFDLVFAFPWSGEEPMMHDIMRRYGGRDARLLLHSVTEGVQVYRGGRLEN